MLSIETEARIAKILLALAEGERTIEVSRQILSDNYDFDSYQIFKFLDTECKNRVDACNIINFLRCKGIYANECEANLLIFFYDQDCDGCLSYVEFLNLVQSDKSLKKTSFSNNQNISFNVEYSLTKLLEKEINLAREIISLLNDLRLRYDYNVHDIFHLLKNCNVITNDSIRCFLDRNQCTYLESDVRNILKRLDINRDGLIDLCEFHAFLGYPNCRRCCPTSACCICGCICCNSCICEVPCFIHNCVHPCPTVCCSPKKVYCEPICPPKICTSPCRSPCRSPKRICSPVCSPKRICCSPVVRCSPICSPCRSPCPPRCYSPKPICPPPQNLNLNDKTKNILSNSGVSNSTMFRTQGQGSFNNSSNINPPNSPPRMNRFQQSSSPVVQRLSPNLSLRLSPERRFSPKYSPRREPSPPIQQQPQPLMQSNFNNCKPLCEPIGQEQCQFNDYLCNVMNAESQIEQAKIDLALRSDFNCEDAFRIFELDGRGFLTESDLKCGLSLLDVCATDEDVRNLMKRFDLNKEGVLNYADFFDMLVPYEKDYRNMVENRVPNSCCPCRCPEVFMYTTRLYLKNLFNSLICYENKFNCMKKGFAGVRCNLRDIFRNIDVCCRGRFNEQDFLCYLKKNCIFTNTKDADLLFIRLDKNRDGCVDCFELEDELKPVY